MQILTTPPSRQACRPLRTPQENPPPAPPDESGLTRGELLGCGVGALVMAYPSVSLGIQAGRWYGPEIAETLTRKGLTWLANGTISGPTAQSLIQFATNPVAQAQVGGLAIGTLGMLVGAGTGYLIARALTTE